MSLYDKRILPKLVHFACSLQPAMRQRQKIVPLAKVLIPTKNGSEESRYFQFELTIL